MKHVCTDGPICDVGCGSGGHFRFFGNCDTRHFYLGLDISFHPSWRSQRAPGNRIPCRFTRMSAVDLGIASDRLAFVFSSSALEHILNIQQAIREMARAMRPGAYGLHIVPGVWSLFLYTFHGYRRFSPQGLADLFQQAGLNVTHIWSLGGLPSFVLHGVWITLMCSVFRLDMRRRKALYFYSWLLGIVLRLDRWVPFASAGYGVLVQKP